MKKNPNDTIGSRTRDLLAYSAVPQPTAPPRAPTYQYNSCGGLVLLVELFIYVR